MHSCPAPQAAKTYLEKHFEAFPTASLEELVQHGLKALAATLGEGELTKQNVSLAIVGGGAPFVMLDDEDVEPYVTVSQYPDVLLMLHRHHSVWWPVKGVLGTA